MLAPFGRTKEIEGQVDAFLDTIVQGVLSLEKALVAYLDGQEESFAELIAKIARLEHKADDIRKQTETTLYTYSLIPELRGDVLALLENSDNLIDRCKEIVQKFDVEQPDIPPEYRAGFLEVARASAGAVDHVVSAARAFFREVTAVRDHINKVDFHETEADRAGVRLKRALFDSDLPLARKLHLRYFEEQIESLSDIAESVGERIAIATIKRRE